MTEANALFYGATEAISISVVYLARPRGWHVAFRARRYGQTWPEAMARTVEGVDTGELFSVIDALLCSALEVRGERT